MTAVRADVLDVLGTVSHHPIAMPAVVPGYRCCNPSIAWVHGKLECLVRTVNYTIRPDGSYRMPEGDPTIRTINFLTDIREDLTVGNARVLWEAVADQKNIHGTVRGWEDMRLFSDGVRRCASATRRDQRPDMQAEIAVCTIGDDGKVEPIHTFAGSQHEKNWMPIEGGGLKWLYRVTPTRVIHLVGGSGERRVHTNDVLGQTQYLTSARGGSQLIRLPDPYEESYLAVVHTVDVAASGLRTYYHRFVLFDSGFHILHVSPPWHLALHRIEFCAGAAVVPRVLGNLLVMSFGVGDESARLVSVDLHAAIQYTRGPDKKFIPRNEFPGIRGMPDNVTGSSGAVAAGGPIAYWGLQTGAAVAGGPTAAAAITNRTMDPIAEALRSPPPTPDATSAALRDILQTVSALSSKIDGIVANQGTLRSDTDRCLKALRKTLTQGKAEEPAETPDGEPAEAPPFLVSTTITDSNETILEAAFRSVVDHVDLCILVDTGIQDRSLRVAQDVCGAKLRVFQYTFREDFAAARNYALECAESLGAAWAVTCDSDERIAFGGPFAIRQTLHASATSGQSHLLVQDQDGGYEKERFIRLGQPGAARQGRWHGRTHECYLGPAFQTLDHALVSFTELHKDGTQIQTKLLRDKRLLEQQIAEEPHDGRWPYYLAQTLGGLGGVDNIRQAIAHYRTSAQRHSGDHAAWAMFKAASLATTIDDHAECLRLCTEGLAFHPGYSELAWLAGVACARLGRLEHACAWARMSAAGGILGVRISRSGYYDRIGIFEGPFDILEHHAATADQRAEGKRLCDDARVRRLRGDR